MAHRQVEAVCEQVLQRYTEQSLPGSPRLLAAAGINGPRSNR
jgi:hypothetical protein